MEILVEELKGIQERIETLHTSLVDIRDTLGEIVEQNKIRNSENTVQNNKINNMLDFVMGYLKGCFKPVPYKETEIIFNKGGDNNGTK